MTSPPNALLPTEEVERVARAMARDELAMGDPEHEVEQRVDDQWPLYKPLAKVAITAMRALAPKVDEGVVAVLQRARDCIMLANHETGICCCGNAVEAHGMGDGHSPVDEGVYYMQGTIESIDAAIAALVSRDGV